ncbi:protein kinase subdomain-containing protein PKL [Suillus discolor]|uniref:Protein kinase subdomain-containing protein PKL n=1 Tax=Suillus discolor TaxID=1912936 RepID=A0A9P7EW46_9AGAM|nr:protein kinase subdomain-containing protein PKL [Suillus discolor]KAG2092518.1 protein kinase subdomain-containing protein PKL [Suillus discolor]
MPVQLSTDDDLDSPPPSNRNLSLSPLLYLVKAFLSLTPPRWKPAIYDAIIGNRYMCTSLYHDIFRLPFGLVLEVVKKPSYVEADALRFVSTLQDIHAPRYIDSVSSQYKSYLLTTWVEGDCVGDVWDDLTASDKERLAHDLRHQLSSMRLQTRSYELRAVCNAPGGPVDDPRIPWVARENLRMFPSSQDFAARLRDGVPIVFSHGDLLPKNLIFPGGLNHWRSGGEKICIIDWEYAGWMPIFWDALKATWLECEPDTEWLQMMRTIFPDCIEELDADWQWRSRSRVTIL